MNYKFINTYQKLGEGFYSETQIDAFEKPCLVHYNNDLAKEMGLGFLEDEALKYFSGNKILKGSNIVSTIYSGHQFGSYVPQLGDGRAHLLGEIENKLGESYELQLKGSGKTPYSRFGDGKAVLRSSIREYLASEAMHYLGIPTTRALCIIGSDEDVMREGIEKAAMVTRVSSSFVRFGHFEYFTHTKKPEHTKKLADYIIDKFYPEITNDKDKYQKFFYKTVVKTAKLMAQWQAFGFAHGVMNTDNMSILGLTIDYGPYGFVDGFNPAYVPNASDHSARYSFHNQPNIGMWNLNALAYALEPVLKIEQAGEVLQLFHNIFLKDYTEIMSKKLGFKKTREDDLKSIDSLLRILAVEETDYVIFFRFLSEYKIKDENKKILDLFQRKTEIKEWLSLYERRLMQEDWPELNKDQKKAEEKRQKFMKKHNPKYILRNYLVENAIKQATYAKDYSEIDKLMKIVKTPYEEQYEHENYAALPPEWSRDICISCSS